jgi:hypothetical protein
VVEISSLGSGEGRGWVTGPGYSTSLPASRPEAFVCRTCLVPASPKLRKPYYTGQTELVLEPTAFLRRLFAIIPPPRWHLTRYHGIFGACVA